MESDAYPASGFGFAGDARVIGQLAWVVFDEEDGTVVHGHGAVCLEGGEMPTDEAFQQRALELATRFRDASSRRLLTMMVTSGELASGGPMRVDLTTKRLIVDDRATMPASDGRRNAAS